MALRILVLDDEPIVCKRLKPAFQKAGYEVETFTDSAAALQRMAESKFDVIITDLKMEGADGFQVLERARELLPQARIVVITGFATLDTAKAPRARVTTDRAEKAAKRRSRNEMPRGRERRSAPMTGW